MGGTSLQLAVQIFASGMGGLDSGQSPGMVGTPEARIADD